MTSSPLDRVHMVLVHPQGPRNVGAVARAMVNFGLSHLHQVGGPDLAHGEVRMMAVKAQGVLDAAQVVSSVEEATRGLTCLFGTTARRRDRLPTLSPREAAPLILQEAARGEVGLLFGQEDHGLKASILRRTARTIAIPASPACRALNLAQAVLVISYELFLAARETPEPVSSSAGRLADAPMLERLKGDLSQAGEILGIVHAGTATAHLQSLDRLLARGPLQTRDLRLLFALAHRIQELEAHLLPLRGPRRNNDCEE